MYSPTVFSDGLERLVRNAVDTARQTGQYDVVSRLEAVLQLASVAGDDSALELDLLAGEVRRGGNRVALARGERALLIALAVRRRSCTRDDLVELLYPHLDEATAVVQLKVYVHRVRRRLDDPRAIV